MLITWNGWKIVLAMIFEYPYVTRADIRYEREVAYGTTPVAQYQHDPDDPTKTLHRVVTGEQVNAEAQMIWQDFKDSKTALSKKRRLLSAVLRCGLRNRG